MKIYTQDHGWAGVIVVIADSEESARDMMGDCLNYKPDQEIKEQEIQPGLIVENIGDS